MKNASSRTNRRERGASLLEVIVQAFVLMAVAPLIVCCALQTVTSITAVVVPWAALVLIVVGVCVCAAVVLSAGGFRRDLPGGPEGGVGGDGEPVLPVRRPPPLPAPREGRDHR